MIVIGAGRVGGALKAKGREVITLIDRTSGWEALDGDAGEPIMVATRNHSLAAVVERVPVHRMEDLVFIQNGMIRGFLAKHNLEGATRGILFFAIPHRGASIEPGGVSIFCGPLAAKAVASMRSLDVPSKQVEEAELGAVELEKLIWNCTFGLLCDVHHGPVGDIVDRHRNEIVALATEFADVGAQELGVRLEVDHLVERLCEYSRSIPSYQAAVKEWDWRNGWFVETAAKLGLEMPHHKRLLNAR